MQIKNQFQRFSGFSGLVRSWKIWIHMWQTHLFGRQANRYTHTICRPNLLTLKV